MANQSNIHTIFDNFISEVDNAIDSGNPNILQKAIINYKDLVAECYIKMAKAMYEQMITEKIEDLNI
jgi:hypothetical protein